MAQYEQNYFQLTMTLCPTLAMVCEYDYHPVWWMVKHNFVSMMSLQGDLTGSLKIKSCESMIRDGICQGPTAR